MRTLNFYLPASKIEELQKFAKKVLKNVPDFSIEISKPFNKVFYHIIVIETKQALEPMWHSVCGVKVNIPDYNGWRLLATFEDGLMFITDYSKKLEFSNPVHGITYYVCDVCKHHMINSHVIQNTETGEELQVGCECVKKFGIPQFNWISKFTRELYRSLIIDVPSDNEPLWPSNWSDKSAFRAIETSRLISAAKEHYNEKPVWVKGDWNSKSPSSEYIQDLVEVVCADEDYATKVCEHIKNTIDPETSEFSNKMVETANNYYSQPSDACIAFFMVKNYEEYIKSQQSNYVKVEPGMQLYVTGKVIKIDYYEGFYGKVTAYTILTPSGRLINRKGAINMNPDKSVQFYAMVKGLNREEIEVDRALKHPKKGIEVITI